MKQEFTLRTLGVAIGLALAAPALFAQTPAAAPKPVSPPAVVKPAAPVTAPAVAQAKPAAAAATPAAPATPAPAAGTPAVPGAPADPNAPPPAPPPPPLSDIIFTNGDVITLDDKRPAAQAVAVKGTKIIAVGKAKEILARWKSEGTEVVDLAGKTLVPGFVDAWGQMSRLGLYSVAAPLQPPPAGSVTDVNGLVRSLRDWSKGDLAQRFGWVIGYGYDDSRLREQRPLTRQDLDAVSADKPVLVIHHSGRQVVLNSRALELAGITRDSANPPAGSIGRWPGSREPDGVLDGAAAAALLGALPKLSADDRQALIQQGQTLYLQNGYTTAVEGRATPEDLALYTQAADTGALKLDVMIYADLASAGSALKSHKSVGPKYYKNRLRLAGVSFALDGVAEDRSAWLTQPYQLPPPGKRSAYSGYPWATDEAAAELFTRAAAGGWPVAVQANGDAAIDQAIAGLRAAAAVQPASPTADQPSKLPAKQRARQPLSDAARQPAPPRPPLLVGAQAVGDAQLDELKEAGAAVSFAPQRLALSLAALKDYTLGPERAARFAPAAAAQARGLPVMLHADPARLDPSPFALMAAAIKRPLGEDQQLAPLDALKAVTLQPARQLGEEKVKGSIAAGKLADFAVLSANPLKTPADKLGEIRVVGTVKEGVTVFSSNEGGVPITR
ncbi:amidohydrolase [Zoogloea sp.]|uniref:amidohydrolase n=1 Tax=Zoogloea sp. TaxID=49181 RepID=UPI002616736C|nr:amidohydrolase family protein [uncultured Zoogloea sp.]